MSETRLPPGSVAVLIPAYNAAAHIGDVIARCAAIVGLEHVWVVNDGSRDDTAAVAARAGAHVLEQPRNRGKGRALARGFSDLADHGYAAVVSLDADGQHLPEEIPGLIAIAERTGADLVVGSRMRNTAGMPWLRVVVNHGMSWFISALAGRRIEDSQSGFRLHRAGMLRAITLVTDRYETETEILIKAGRRGYRIASAPISTIYGDEKSGINPFVDTLRFCRLVVRSVGWW